MSLLTIVEASKQFNVGRTAIYKAIKKGELTAQINHDGIKVVDAQDMIRIFRLSSKKAVSDAVRIFLTRVVAEQAIPFDVRVPNAKTVSALNEADELIQAKKARFETVEDLFNELEKNS